VGSGRADISTDNVECPTMHGAMFSLSPFNDFASFQLCCACINFSRTVIDRTMHTILRVSKFEIQLLFRNFVLLTRIGLLADSSFCWQN
jgi:hypothetical protein